MKAILRWIAGVIGTIIALAATIVLLPYAGDIVNKVMPDVTSAAERTAGVISSKLSESARLESITVSESGTVNHDLSLAGISVGGVTFDYDYTASFGIDLKRVQMVVSGNKIVFMLPQPELILDDLVPRNISRKDTLVIISDDDYEALIERERLACRARYLSGDRQQELWDATVRVMQSTVEVWLTNVDDRLSFEYALLAESGGS